MSIRNNSLRVCLRLPAYSASAKVICFIGKLGGWRSAILPKSESLFQSFPKSITREVKSESLISGYRVLSETVAGRVDRVEIEAPNWVYKEVIDSHGSAVLTVSQDYFLIDSAIARFIYRLARRAAGSGGAKWGFKTIYERSGVTSFKEFCRILRRLIKSDSLPEYHLCEEAGLSGPQLIMTRRSTEHGCG
ncbi:MAG: hypothetical protein E6Q69_15305 [Aquipseudomonas alcaligenes]|uniref:Uncharacterized protein n=1 Tax=Aquipseudomonas alcaligenes TaxID=43263 RepID=A0A5C7VVS8_AQUAC|nr:MAG: hypothetical protein E6Q69_15305 [Pseudomonas alcaligenes]